MWEVQTDDDRTHDDVDRDEVAAGEVEPLVINGLDLEQATVTGIPVGMTSAPGDKWRRLLWRQLADRLHIDLDHQPFPPSTSIFPYRSWPSSIAPPCEGSLDRDSLDELTEVLAAHSPRGRQEPCYFFHEPTHWIDPDSAFRTGPLGSIPLYGDASGQRFTPSNIWSASRAWFVYTDYDLHATKVSGPHELIASLQAHPDLETLIWSTRPSDM